MDTVHQVIRANRPGKDLVGCISSVLVIACLVVLFLHGYGNAESNEEITVSAAMSLKGTLEEIAQAFEIQERKTTVILNFGASGNLARQIEAGAPVDVFASASPRDMDVLEKQGFIASGSRVDFARNALVLIQPAKPTQPLSSLTDLAADRVRRIAVGDPRSVPAGQYAEACLRSLKLYEQVQSKLIFSGTVRQVLDYVARGEVDAGLVYGTDLRLGGENVRLVVQAPPASHPPIVYPVAVVYHSNHAAPARRFVDFVISQTGRAILRQHGFGTFP